MSLIYPHRLPGLFYRTFVQDFRRVFRVLPKALKLRVHAVFALQLLSALTETATLLVISLFALTMAAPEAAASHFLVRSILDFFPAVGAIAADPRHLVILTSSLMVFFVFVKCGLTIYSAQWSSVLAQRVGLEVAGQALSGYLAWEYEDHLRPESQGAVHNILNRDRLAIFIAYDLFFFANVINCLALFVSLSVIEPKLTLIVVVVFGLASLVVYSLVRRELDRHSQKVQDYVIKEGQEMVALSQGVREVLIYGRQKTAFERVQALGRVAIKSRAIVNFYSHVPTQALEAVGFGTIGLMVVLMIAWGLPLPEIIASTSILMLTAWRILPAVSRCLAYTVTVRTLRPQALAILSLAEERRSAGLVQPDPNFAFRKSLDLVEAAFAYPGSKAAAVKNLNLSIQKGQSVGLIGTSGSGKTTLALLLSGLVKPHFGQFLVDGQPLTPARQAAYFRILGYVPQNPLLVEGTLADNVAFSRWGESYDRDRVLAACQEAAVDFVQTHPKGLDQPIAPASLSGGQAQRTAIARALYPKPEVIVFDEATSALDQASENVIKNALDRLKGRLTSVIVAHRLSTVENCDLLVWVEAGAIRAVGPPKTLLPLYEKT
ncbi:MAG: ABC transporter ATP-binding protein/permease, partial [Deltaproteobacteria bacterium]|nr:ABC transporter ATP-binding protein/permease [Deltaproteobacteria bacterium]